MLGDNRVQRLKFRLSLFFQSPRLLKTPQIKSVDIIIRIQFNGAFNQLSHARQFLLIVFKNVLFHHYIFNQTRINFRFKKVHGWRLRWCWLWAGAGHLLYSAALG